LGANCSKIGFTKTGFAFVENLAQTKAANFWFKNRPKNGANWKD